MTHLPRNTRRWAMTAVLATAAVVAGCATGPREITSNVTTYARMADVPLPATYRLELLPSQSQQQSFARIEQAADNALRRVGLTRDSRPDLARLVVQVGAAASQGYAYHPSYDPFFYGPRFGWSIGLGGRRGGIGLHGMDVPPTTYYRSVKLLLRDQKTQQIVYETSAEYNEVWMDDNQIWDMLFDAALTHFPHSPGGTRQVRTQLQPMPPAPSLSKDQP